MSACRCSGFSSLIVVLVVGLSLARATAGPADFSGQWQTYWRTGDAVLRLEQEGEVVTGSYQPDNGVVEGRANGRVFTGTWRQAGSSGTVIFTLSEDGKVLTGRFGNGEFWNGFRDDVENGSSTWALANGSPRETLRSILIAANQAIYAGDSGALPAVNNLVVYEGEAGTANDRSKRRTLMFDILDMATLRIMDVPDGPAAPGEDELTFAIGPAGASARIDLLFRRAADGSWRLALPDVGELAAERARLLTALGYESMAELNRARADSPRAVLREFIVGAVTWDEGGRDRALAVMDLSHIPERLRPLEGPVYADILKRIFDRVAFIVWQEIPDDPDLSVPYTYFRHPVGNITIAKVTDLAPEAAATASGRETTTPRSRWKIDTATLLTAPALLEAMKDMPPIPGLETSEALSAQFRLRESVRAASPNLVARWGYLEAWQWLGLASSLVVAALSLALVRVLFRALSGGATTREHWGQLGLAAGLVAAALIVNLAVTRLGLRQVGLPVIATITSILLTLATAYFAYRVVSVIGGWFMVRAEKTISYVDEIATSLGTGLAKLLIVGATVITLADVVGLPYEGVLAGLGVGGIAIAFAARDTVSNLMGGGILIADRPFQRGDLIEHEGVLATVEQVGLRSTKLRALDDTLLAVPNSHLSDRKIANWGKRRRRKMTLAVGVTYDTPRDRLDAFVEGLKNLLGANELVDSSDINVGLSAFGASSIDIELMYFFRVHSYQDQVDAQHKLMIGIMELAETIGVQFAFPTRTVHVAGPAVPLNAAMLASRDRGEEARPGSGAMATAS